VRAYTTTRRVLLVEDNELVLKALASELGQVYEVVEARTGEEALALLAQPGGFFDAIVSDYDLGMGASGAEVLERARRRLPSSLCVLLVGAVRRELPVVEACMADLLVKKPARPGYLVATLRRQFLSKSLRHQAADLGVALPSR